jgi:hypothetical protein
VNLRDKGIIMGTSGDSVILQNAGPAIVGIPPGNGSYYKQGPTS